MATGSVLWEEDAHAFAGLRATLTGITFRQAVDAMFKHGEMSSCRLNHKHCKHAKGQPCTEGDILFLYSSDDIGQYYRWQGVSGRIIPER